MLVIYNLNRFCRKNQTSHKIESRITYSKWRKDETHIRSAQMKLRASLLRLTAPHVRRQHPASALARPRLQPSTRSRKLLESFKLMRRRRLPSTRRWKRVWSSRGRSRSMRESSRKLKRDKLRPMLLSSLALKRSKKILNSAEETLSMLIDASKLGIRSCMTMTFRLAEANEDRQTHMITLYSSSFFQKLRYQAHISIFTYQPSFFLFFFSV